jgi:site-specific recombinase XerD
MNQQKFYNWLLSKGLTERSSTEHSKNIIRFEIWAKEENYININELNYNELLGYAQQLKKTNLKPQSINIRFNSITKYYDYQKEEGVRDDNPARRLRIKKEGRRILKNIFSMNQLEEIYMQYTHKNKFREESHKNLHQRNVVILGLMIYQAIHSGELKKIETSDINLTESKIYIPSTARSNSREIKLQANQIIPLHIYLNETREKLEPKENYLINGNTHNIVNWLIKDLIKTNPQLRNAQQIRASVFMHWLKLHGIRKVQYLCGHKHIGSTEQYREQDLEGLQKQLMKYHPFS